MRKIFAYLIFAFLLLAFQVSQGQNIDRYQLIESGNVGTLTPMAGSRQLIGSNSTNTASDVESIGFDFVFMGKPYNSFSVNANGVLRLGDEPVLATANTYGIPGNDRIVPLSGRSVQERYWFFGWRWRETQADLGTSSSGRVHYKVIGSAPERTLVIEWSKMEIPEGSESADITFQLRLHESAVSAGVKSGNIEFLYDEGSLNNNYRRFSFRTGFGIGPERGNFVAINHASRETIHEQNYVSGPVSDDISYFQSNHENDKLLYTFAPESKPEGTFSNFRLICPAPNAMTFGFEEDCPDEAGIIVYRKNLNQPEHQFKKVASLPPDARSFSDEGVGLGTRYVYRFYFVGEGRFSDTFTDFETEPVVGGGAMQAIRSGKWSNSDIWGGTMPHNLDDVVVGCVGSVFVTADANAAINSLTIEKGSFLTIEDGVTLSVSGDFVNKGVFNPVGTGRLVLNGNNVQSITNSGQGITDDHLFTAPGGRPQWNNDETGLVAEKVLEVAESEFAAIKAVKVDIEHDYLRDLTLYLVAPDGSSFTLSRGRGGWEQDYDDVMFVETGRPLPPTVQNIGLTGEYRPEESFANYAGPFHGSWKLQVRDDFTGIGGRLNSFELTLSRGGSNDLVMRRVSIENSSPEGVLLNSGLVIQENLHLLQGIVHSSESATLLLEAGATCNEGNKNSFVDGPVLKKGNANFVFPLGNGGHWAPLAIENLRGANDATTFKAAYHKQAPGQREQLDGNMDKVSELEYWDLSPVSGTATLDLVLYWKDAEISQIIDIQEDDLIVAHFTDGQWQNEEGVIMAGSATGKGGEGAIKAYDISTFSPFTFGSLNGINPLPVELLSFTGTVEGDGVILNWKTASERNNSHFEIQRSNDAAKWQKIGTVNGAGTTNRLQHYHFNDPKVSLGDFFYRLKQIDYDGAFEYSNVISIQISGAGKGFKIFPNPGGQRFALESSFYPAELIIWSQSGVPVYRKEIQGEETKVDLPELVNGVYVISLSHSQGVQYKKLLINK